MSRINVLGIAAVVAIAVAASAAALVQYGRRADAGLTLVGREAMTAMAPAGPVKGTDGGGVMSAKAASRDGRGTFIVVFDEAPLASYQGGVAGIPAPSRDRLSKGGRMRLDPSSVSARAYVAYLQKRQADLNVRMSSMAGRTLRARMTMQHALNAMVVDLSLEEAEAIRGLAGVGIVEEYDEYEVTTDRGPQLIGAEPVWNGTNAGAGGQQYRGEGMVVAVLDTGINFGSPSFAATGPVDGFTHTNPLGAGTYLGTCASGGVDIGRCNAKLIGGFDFVCGAPANQCGQTDVREEPGFGDNNGHGTHVASTAAGNARDADFSGAPRRISGVAPHANIVAYDICYHDLAAGTGRCPSSSAVAAIDHIVASGVVDVVNYSIGGGSEPWTATVSLAFLNAVEAGVYISASAGNSGPDADTVSHLQPWVASIGAVQHGRGGYAIQLSVTGPTPVPSTLMSITAAEGTGGTPHSGPIAGTTPLKVSPTINVADDGCAGYVRGTFDGAIAVVRRGTCSFSTKVASASSAGAIAVIIANNVAGTLVPSVPGTSVPAFAVTQAEGDALRDFAATRPNTTAGIGFPASPLANTPDVVASFSSRGPASTLNVLKPDISAPGVSILAADAGSTITGFETLVGLKSGTSMASPHHVGAVALLRQARPSWSVPEVKSAFALTAYDQVLATNETSPATPFDTGSGRIRVDRAINAGLVMHETGANYRAANPETGGNPTTLNQPNLVNGQCGANCSFIRRFRNPQATASTWNLQLSGINGTVPASITVPAGGTVSVTIALRPAAAALGTWSFASLTLTPVGGMNTPLRMPIAVIGSTSAGVNLMTLARSGASGRTEVHTLTRDSGYQVFSQHIATALQAIGSGFGWDLFTADYNRDGVKDLYTILRNGSSGTTEVHVMNGADGFQSFLLHRATALGPSGADDSWQFRAVDYNNDGFQDIMLILRAGGSGKTEVHVLDGATGYTTFLAHIATALTASGTDPNWTFEPLRWDNDARPDLAVIFKQGSSSTEVHILNGASNYQDFLLHRATALQQTGGNYLWEFKFGDYDRDGTPDLYAIHKQGGSGKVDLHVLDGKTQFTTFSAHIATAIGSVPSDNSWEFELVD